MYYLKKGSLSTKGGILIAEGCLIEYEEDFPANLGPYDFIKLFAERYLPEVDWRKGGHTITDCEFCQRIVLENK